MDCTYITCAFVRDRESIYPYNPIEGQRREFDSDWMRIGNWARKWYANETMNIKRVCNIYEAAVWCAKMCTSIRGYKHLGFHAVNIPLTVNQSGASTSPSIMHINMSKIYLNNSIKSESSALESANKTHTHTLHSIGIHRVSPRIEIRWKQVLANQAHSTFYLTANVCPWFFASNTHKHDI